MPASSISRAGEQFRFDDAVLEVLAPTTTAGSENDNGVIVRFRYGAADVLFAADLEVTGEATLARASPQVDVIKVVQHGSKTSSTPDFLRAVAPQVAVVSVGASNRYGHPNPDVIARLEEATGYLYRTAVASGSGPTADGPQIAFRFAVS